MFLSGDGGLLHVIKRLRLKGKDLHVFFIKSKSKLMLETVDTFIDLTTLNEKFTKKATETDCEF
jgi:uncharacterized LabA/DUF88 family protein